jgi:hypothetical protein
MGDKGSGRRTHGRSNTQEYRIWSNMRRRCSSPTYNGYKHYGGRGITVCERWQNFENFLADMGERPSSSHSLDRINNNGSYSPENCRWSTQKEQCNNNRHNKYVVVNGETLTLTQLAERHGLPPQLVTDRAYHGCPVDQLTRPSGQAKWRHGNKWTGKTLT